MNIPVWVWLIVGSLVAFVIGWSFRSEYERAKWHWFWKHRREHPNFDKVYEVPGGFIYLRSWRYLECRNEKCKKANHGDALPL